MGRSPFHHDGKTEEGSLPVHPHARGRYLHIRCVG